MANEYKVLGQVGDASSNDQPHNTVRASTSAIVSSIVVCNRENAANTFNINVKVGGGTVANEDRLAFETSIAANDTVTLTLGITLAATDVISVGASDANVTFSAFGTQIT